MLIIMLISIDISNVLGNGMYKFFPGCSCYAKRKDSWGLSENSAVLSTTLQTIDQQWKERHRNCFWFFL